MENTAHYIVATYAGTKILLPSSEILRAESVGTYTVFYLRNSTEQYVCSRNIGRVQKELQPELFLRIHRSHIINLNEIKIYRNARGGKVVLSDNTVITVAQRRKTELLRYLHRMNKKLKNEKTPVKNKPDARITIRTK